MQNLIDTEINFSGGAYAISYQSGFASYLLNLLGKDYLKNCAIGGISSGAAVSGYLHSAVYSDIDMSFMYENYIKCFYT